MMMKKKMIFNMKILIVLNSMKTLLISTKITKGNQRSFAEFLQNHTIWNNVKIPMKILIWSRHTLILSHKAMELTRNKIKWNKNQLLSKKDNLLLTVNKFLENMNKNYTKSTITKIPKKDENLLKPLVYNKFFVDQVLLRSSLNYLS